MPPTDLAGEAGWPGLPRLSRLLTTTYCVFPLLVPAVRTPFTCLLDAEESNWVLSFPVTIRGQLQTGEGYHRSH